MSKFAVPFHIPNSTSLSSGVPIRYNAFVTNLERRVLDRSKGLNSAQSLRRKLNQLGDPNRAKLLQRFFKTGPGEYAEGDVFLGLTVPQVGKLGKESGSLRPLEIQVLLRSPIHEQRLLALFLLIRAFQKGSEEEKKRIFRLYLGNTKYVNNWDLVDASAEKIMGPFLQDKSKVVLYRLARSKNLWERRIAVLSTFHFIKQGEFSETLKIVKMLLQDQEDLIHKAAGWMLREIGKRNLAVEEEFLKKHCRQMPRTMLRYAIERFSPELRQRYLAGQI